MENCIGHVLVTLCLHFIVTFREGSTWTCTWILLYNQPWLPLPSPGISLRCTLFPLIYTNRHVNVHHITVFSPKHMHLHCLHIEAQMHKQRYMYYVRFLLPCVSPSYISVNKFTEMLKPPGTYFFEEFDSPALIKVNLVKKVKKIIQFLKDNTCILIFF